MLLTTLTPRHYQSQFCVRQSSRRTRLRSQELRSTFNPVPFRIDDTPIEFVSEFRYLGRIISKDDTDDSAAYTRLQKAKQVWGRFSTLLRTDGASVLTMSRFYRTVIQQTLLFGSATWVLTQRALG